MNPPSSACSPSASNKQEADDAKCGGGTESVGLKTALRAVVARGGPTNTDDPEGAGWLTPNGTLDVDGLTDELVALLTGGGRPTVEWCHVC